MKAYPFIKSPAGEGEGDDEQIQVDLSKIPANVEKIAFTVTIYEAEARSPPRVSFLPRPESVSSRRYR